MGILQSEQRVVVPQIVPLDAVRPAASNKLEYVDILSDAVNSVRIDAKINTVMISHILIKLFPSNQEEYASIGKAASI